MNTSEILLDETGDSSLEDLIKQGVIDYNVPYLGPWDPKSFTFYIKNLEDKVIAGLWGYYLEGRFANIEFCWVEEKQRGKKLGAKLMKEAVEFLKSHKCPYVELYTLDFQAKPFYEKYGFVLLGTIPGWGLGRDAHFMRKELV
jgi:GNAT superfamily N-acetyltransferase